MESFHEQLYKRKKRFIDIVMRIVIVLSALVVGTVIFIAFRQYLGGLGRLLGALAVAGIVYLAYRIFVNFDVEFEYTCFGGEIDIDKIMNQTIRKKVICIEIKTISEFGKYDNAIKQQMDERQFDTKINLISYRPNEQIYYAILKHHTLGNTYILFEPDDIILNEINKQRRTNNGINRFGNRSDRNIQNT